MKIEKGMAVNVEGMSKTIKMSIVKKLKSIGFKVANNRNDLFSYEWSFIGVGKGGLIDGADRIQVIADVEITLPDLMFCDKPDEITHCYYDGNLRYASGNPLYGDPDLICTREAKPEQSWYEKGELPPVGEVVEYAGQDSPVQTMILGHHPDKSVPVCWHQAMTDSFEDLRTYSVDGASYFRPIQLEREKAIKAALKAVGTTPFTERYSKEIFALLYDAGMLKEPSND